MSVEKIVTVVVTSTKNEVVYDQILKDKNFQATSYIRGLRGEKGEKGDVGGLKEISDIELERLFE